jgi:signal transduction histidine kinase
MTVLTLPDQAARLTRRLGSQAFAAFDLLQAPLWVVACAPVQPIYANAAALDLFACRSVDEWAQSARLSLPQAVHDALEQGRMPLTSPLQGLLRVAQQAGGGDGVSAWRDIACSATLVSLEDASFAVLVEGVACLPLAAEGLSGPAEDALAQTTVMVSVFDQGGRVVFQNPAACAAYGSGADELGAFLNRIPDAQDAVRAWASARQGRPYRCETQIRTADGLRWHALEARLAPPSAMQPLLRVVVTEHDISEVVQNQQSLRETVERLARINGELEQFAWITSHDLREPLRTVVSYLTLLERHLAGKMDATAHDFMDFAVKGARRMDALTRDLLLYANIGRNPIPRHPVSLQALISTVVAERRSVLEACQGQITFHALPTVMGDLQDFTILFSNLLDNAIAYRKADQPLRVQVVAEQEAKGWLIAVIDNGQGINPRYFERIFQIFQRLQIEDDPLRTGVGLALCRKVVERHGGRIWLESSEGRGAAFFLSFPSG